EFRRVLFRSTQKVDLTQGQKTLSFQWDDIALWTPETPNLYLLRLQVKKDNQLLHEVTQRFGFRTLDFKKKDGIYVNGKKIVMKGINRHSLWPESGRSTDKEISIMDVNLIKRSEERRVGKECRSRGGAYHEVKKTG